MIVETCHTMFRATEVNRRSRSLPNEYAINFHSTVEL